ncbi:hypothetical protein G9A89_003027 [Geosiphon pyriformis]|nr:hypothetical protein G9A89_003027 [Geosiphon pyriformis]
MTARLNPATTLRKKLGKLLEDINTIESLSIIQRTQPKPLDSIKTFRYNTYGTALMELAFEHQVTVFA